MKKFFLGLLLTVASSFGLAQAATNYNYTTIPPTIAPGTFVGNGNTFTSAPSQLVIRDWAPEDFGAPGDAQQVIANVTTTNGGCSITVGGTTPFNQTLDPGKIIVIPTAGASGATLVSQIVSVGTPGGNTTIVVGANSTPCAGAVLNASPVFVTWGHDDTTGFNAALAAKTSIRTANRVYMITGTLNAPAGKRSFLNCAGSRIVAAATMTYMYETTEAGYHNQEGTTVENCYFQGMDLAATIIHDQTHGFQLRWDFLNDATNIALLIDANSASDAHISHVNSLNGVEGGLTGLPVNIYKVTLASDTHWDHVVGSGSSGPAFWIASGGGALEGEDLHFFQVTGSTLIQIDAGSNFIKGLYADNVITGGTAIAVNSSNNRIYEFNAKAQTPDTGTLGLVLANNTSGNIITGGFFNGFTDTGNRRLVQTGTCGTPCNIVFGNIGATLAEGLKVGTITENVDGGNGGATVTHALSPYTVIADVDSYLLCDATAGSVTFSLPATTASGRNLTIKKIDSSTNKCFLSGNSTDTVEGSPSNNFISKQNETAKIVDTSTGNWSKLQITATNVASGTDLSAATSTSTSTTTARTLAARAADSANVCDFSTSGYCGDTINAQATVTCNNGSGSINIGFTLPASYNNTGADAVINGCGTPTAQSGLTVDTGGTGYTQGDLLTVATGNGAGGTGTCATSIVIEAIYVVGGVIQPNGAVVTTNGACATKPTNPVTPTGGTGTGATFDLTFVGSPLSTTITGISGNSITVSPVAANNATAVPRYVRVGHDDAPAINAAIATGASNIFFPVHPALTLSGNPYYPSYGQFSQIQLPTDHRFRIDCQSNTLTALLGMTAQIYVPLPDVTTPDGQYWTGGSGLSHCELEGSGLVQYNIEHLETRWRYDDIVLRDATVENLYFDGINGTPMEGNLFQGFRIDNLNTPAQAVNNVHSGFYTTDYQMTDIVTSGATNSGFEIQGAGGRFSQVHSYNVKAGPNFDVRAGTAQISNSFADLPPPGQSGYYVNNNQLMLTAWECRLITWAGQKCVELHSDGGNNIGPGNAYGTAWLANRSSSVVQDGAYTTNVINPYSSQINPPPFPGVPSQLAQGAIPLVEVPSGYISAIGTLIIGQFPSSSATATFGATSGSTTVTFSAASLLNTAADIGRVLTINDTTSVTATSASPAVFTGQTLPNNTPVTLGGTTVPTGFTAGVVYYVTGTSGNTFKLAATSGGTAINSTSTGTAVTATVYKYFTITANTSTTVATGTISGGTLSTVGAFANGNLFLSGTPTTNTSAFSVPLDNVYTNAYCYVPAASPIGTLGWYWCNWQSTTVAQLYNVTYSSGTPTIQASPPVFSGLTPAAYTQSTGSPAIAGYSATIPGGSMGLSGRIDTDAAFTQNNSAGTKTEAVLFKSTNIASVAMTTATTTNLGARITNAGATNAQTSTGQSNSSGTVLTQQVTAPVFQTVDTTIDQTTSVTVKLAAATDWIVIQSFGAVEKATN